MSQSMSMGRRHRAAFSDYLPGYQVRPTGGRQSPADNRQTLPGQTWRVVRGLPRSSRRLTACRRRLIMKTIGGYGLPKIN